MCFGGVPVARAGAAAQLRAAVAVLRSHCSSHWGCPVTRAKLGQAGRVHLQCGLVHVCWGDRVLQGLLSESDSCPTRAEGQGGVALGRGAAVLRLIGRVAAHRDV